VSDNDNYITVESLEQAEKIILEHINNGENYRDIAQITFSINDNIKRFNPSQISKIKGKNEENQAQNRHDSDKSRVFKMFKKGKKLTDVVIDTGLDYDYVKNARKQYLDSENLVEIPKSFYKKIMSVASYFGDTETIFNVEWRLEDLYKSDHRVEEYVCDCSVCGEEMKINDEMLEDAKQYLSSKWGHGNCA